MSEERHPAGQVPPGRAGVEVPERSPAAYHAVVGVSRPVVAALLRLRLDGVLPARGPLIVAPNHISYLDPVALGVTLHRLGRPPWFLVTPALVELPVLGRVMSRGGCIGAGTRAVSVAAELLSGGELVVVYPEGHIAPVGAQMRAKAGIGLLARLSGAPVLPVGQWGMQRMPRRRDVLRRRSAAMVFGAPLPPPAERGQDRRYAEDVLAEVRRLVPRARLLAGGSPQP